MPVKFSDDGHEVRVKGFGFQFLFQGEDTGAESFAAIGETAFGDTAVNQFVDARCGSDILRHGTKLK